MSADCRRPGCPGRYSPDGYCDECGHRAPDDLRSQATAAGTRGSARTGTGRTRGSRSARTAGGRGRLGAGLVEMTRVPMRDPAAAVMAEPVVAETKRYCTGCDKPVGRARDGRPGRTEGFCPHCGTAFSFVPRLGTGDLVHDRYEVLGALAYGGLGWIYLARDRHVSDSVSDRWVVLKGLIDTSDPDAAAAAVTERRYLVEIDHPDIVKIHDFVQHPDPKTGEPAGYIVMEYVGGESLKDLLVARREQTGAAGMPLPEVIAYGVEILPALDYLHGRDLLFCDFKPDNVIQAEEQLKLIDLGAVRHLSDADSAIYGTPGYQAPEIAEDGPSVASDLYTVGRTLAVLALGTRGWTSTYAHRLPTPAEAPLLAEHDAFHRVLRRATHPRAERRFATAAEFSEQLLGVLREVLSVTDGTPRPSTSLRFTPERRPFGTAAGDTTAAFRPGTALTAALTAAQGRSPAATGGPAPGTATVASAGPGTSRSAGTGASRFTAGTSRFAAGTSRFAAGTSRFAAGTGAGHRASGTGAATAAGGPGMDRPAGAGAARTGSVGGAARQASGDPGPDLREVAAALPTPLVDVLDPGAGFLASIGTGTPAEVVAALTAAPVDSPEVSFRLVRAHIEAGALDRAGTELDELAAEDPLDWRVDWHRGLAALAAGDAVAARDAFEAVYHALPGERAARLALAAACECAGDLEAAAGHYARVWAADRGFLSAAFGLARLRLAAGDRAGALTVLDQVPESSAHYLTAQVAATRAGIAGGSIRTVAGSTGTGSTGTGSTGDAHMSSTGTSGAGGNGAVGSAHASGAGISGTGASASGTGAGASGTDASTSGTGAGASGTGAGASGTGASTSGTGASTSGTGASAVDDLLGAARRLERLALDTERQSWLAAELLEAALEWLGDNGAASEVPERILGNTLTERGVRFGLERTYRVLAQHARTREERYALVDRANAVRPRTLV
ncbi:serine/threonine-protein kinase PknG [Catenuloplanes nepalensis]|uniref:non-specific serine/threonine protein kinase n=1 Tax=Catenuloplanes nepalensis TaxID=587533 RepID=A0ABT9MT28_9ACTN|nr:serine/threonine-protein kinase [Catenuloplanes nepalensis]MDP9794590.1 serine/threonine-protein kinase PknG [Catenuloplanes nepalensis]